KEKQKRKDRNFHRANDTWMSPNAKQNVSEFDVGCWTLSVGRFLSLTARGSRVASSSTRRNFRASVRLRNGRRSRLQVRRDGELPPLRRARAGADHRPVRST